MKMRKSILLFGATIAAVAAISATAFAASAYKTPAEVAAAVTGRTVESVMAERVDNNKTYGTIANDAGKLEEFKAELLQMKKDILDNRVSTGSITREQADDIVKALEDAQAICDGTGSGNCTLGSGVGSNGTGLGQGCGYGAGGGRGVGGMGLRDGSCFR